MKAIICDRPGCGCHAPHDNGQPSGQAVGVTQRGPINARGSVGRHRQKDLCEECREELEKWWWSNRPKERPEAT